MKYLLLFLCLLISNHSFGCMIGESGPEYDKLIKLKKLDDLGRYQVSIPSKLDAFSGEPVVTVYQHLSNFESGEWFKAILEGIIKVAMSANEEKLTGIFQINLDKYAKFDVSVYWPPIQSGLCSTSGELSINLQTDL